jgi:hypothetical protein
MIQVDCSQSYSIGVTALPFRYCCGWSPRTLMEVTGLMDSYSLVENSHSAHVLHMYSVPHTTNQGPFSHFCIFDFLQLGAARFPFRSLGRDRPLPWA